MRSDREGSRWLVYLKSITDHADHADIARRIAETSQARGWWAHGLTIAYARHIAHRVPGQRSDDNFEVSASRRRPGWLDDVLERWR